jgi:hypothetical protein
MTRSLKITIAAFVGAICLFVSPVATYATGTINIQRHDGTKDSYKDVEVKIFSGSLFLTSDDGNGTIVVTRSACSYQGEIIVCLPTSAALVQEGQSAALDLKTGTIYVNYTSASQSLSHTSMKLPANSVMVALKLGDGTYINVHGKIDEVVHQ